MLITISRQYAAGGSEIARRVAEALDWRVFDNELVEKVAERAGISADEVAQREERVPGFIDRFARAAALTSPELFVPDSSSIATFEEVKLAQITRDLVAELAREGRMVVVGRAAAAVLASDEGTLRVRLVAPVEARVRTAIDRLGVAERDAPRILEETDRNRDRYHKEFYHRDWNDPVNYHMVLNTHALGYDGAGGVILDRVRALGWS
ncbi:MAG: cytidylate kinase-like family protein [bacterium]|nr:cytidylate kinase-like family protein [bacterium]